MTGTARRVLVVVTITLAAFWATSEPSMAVWKCDLCTEQSPCDTACWDDGAGEWIICGVYGTCVGCCGPGTPPFCGDGMCNWWDDEDCSSCTDDCGTCPDPPSCGDGTCSDRESDRSCPADCPPQNQCGDEICDSGEDINSCPWDCTVGDFCTSTQQCMDYLGYGYYCKNNRCTWDGPGGGNYCDWWGDCGSQEKCTDHYCMPAR